MLRVPSQLSDELERLIHGVIGCCITVHDTLGPGLLEGIYRRAVCIELAYQGISFNVEKDYPVTYRGQLLCHQRLDIVVDDALVLELKAIERLAPGPSRAASRLPGRLKAAGGSAHQLQCRCPEGWIEEGCVVSIFGVFVPSCLRGVSSYEGMSL
jgi:GxxExxY protein